MNDRAQGSKKGKSHTTAGKEVPASMPEVRPEDVIPPAIPPAGGFHEREDDLNRKQLDEELDEGIDQSFPASDPPSIVSPGRADRNGAGGGANPDERPDDREE